MSLLRVDSIPRHLQYTTNETNQIVSQVLLQHVAMSNVLYVLRNLDIIPLKNELTSSRYYISQMVV